MSTGPDFSEYDKRMEDPEYRAWADRTESFTAEEESQLYQLLDEVLGDGQVAEDGEPNAYSEAKFEGVREEEANPNA